MKEVYVVNPPDKDISEMRITKDMAGGFGFNAGTSVILPPLELIYYALDLKNHGYGVHFYDLQANPDKINDLLAMASKSDEAFFLVLVTVPTFETDLALVRKIKNLNHKARIFVKIDVKDKEVIDRILASGIIEMVLAGETENIVHDIFNGEKKEGTAYLENDQNVYPANFVVDDLNNLPDLSVDFLDISKYKYPLLPMREGNFFTFQSSRGCPFPCAYYCPYPLIQGNKWRAMSEEKLYRNIKLLVEKFNVRSILFRDATFTLDKERIYKFCNDILADNLNLNWWCETRMNCLDEKLLEKMSEAGCRGINLGVETGDDELMRAQGKIGGDIAQLIKIRELSAKFKIKLHFLMIVGLPKETKQSLYKSFLLIEKLKPESLGVTTITPYPGTQLYRDAVENNWIVDKNMDNYIGNSVVMKTEHLSAAQIKHGNFLLRLTGYLNKKKTPINSWADKFLKIYFFLWSRI